MLKHTMLMALIVAAAGGPGATQGPATFEVASIKPNTSGDAGQRMGLEMDRFIATNASVRMLIQEAYGVTLDQIVNAPGWVEDERFDVEAKAERPFTARGESQSMLRALLADRFQLVSHIETRPATNHALRVKAPNGALGTSLRRAPMDCAGLRQGGGSPSADPCGMNTVGRAGITGQMRVRGMSLTNLVSLLGRELRAPVNDETGLTGTFDWELTFRPMFLANGPINRERWPNVDPDAPLIAVAIEEQLGLELTSQPGTVSLLVIDRVEHPSAN